MIEFNSGMRFVFNVVVVVFLHKIHRIIYVCR